MKFQKEHLLLYAVTDRNSIGSRTLYDCVKEALQGGVTMVQLREKALQKEEFIAEAVKIKALCREYGVPLIINDSVEVAIESGADGVHVGITDTPVAQIRKAVGKDFIIGATAKTVEQAKIAESEGADYIGVGAVFPSPTKENAIRISVAQLKEICSSVNIPAVAIGGITAENIAELKGGGACGVAVVSAIFASQSIESDTKALKDRVLKVIGEDI